MVGSDPHVVEVVWQGKHWAEEVPRLGQQVNRCPRLKDFGISSDNESGRFELLKRRIAKMK